MLKANISSDKHTAKYYKYMDKVHTEVAKILFDLHWGFYQQSIKEDCNSHDNKVLHGN